MVEGNNSSTDCVALQHGASHSATVVYSVDAPDQPVLMKPLMIKVVTKGLPDTLRIPYGEDLVLGDLPAGRCVLQINAIDRVAKKTASQQTRFSIRFS